MDGHRLPDTHDGSFFFLSGWLMYNICLGFLSSVTGAPRVTGQTYPYDSKRSCQSKLLTPQEGNRCCIFFVNL